MPHKTVKSTLQLSLCVVSIVLGCWGAGVLEVVEDYFGDTFRAVYTVKFPGAVYVLHVFQKKSKSGIKTPKQDMTLIRLRLVLAKEDYERLLVEGGLRLVLNN
jgi:phage-related protein